MGEPTSDERFNASVEGKKNLIVSSERRRRSKANTSDNPSIEESENESTKCVHSGWTRVIQTRLTVWRRRLECVCLSSRFSEFEESIRFEVYEVGDRFAMSLSRHFKPS